MNALCDTQFFLVTGGDGAGYSGGGGGGGYMVVTSVDVDVGGKRCL